MRIVVHGQQAFGKAVLEALLKRGEDVVGVYAAPEKPGQKADPLENALLDDCYEHFVTALGEGLRPFKSHRRVVVDTAQAFDHA